MTSRITSLLIVAALFTSGCREANRTSEVDDDAVVPVVPGAPEPAAPADAGAPTAGRGSGTLRLGAETFSFTVRACDVTGESDDAGLQTLSGRGTTPDGEQFDVFVSRNDVGGMLTHTVSFQTGDVRAGRGRVLEAQRMRHGDSWLSMRGGPAEPLVRIDRQRITATGLFTSDDGTTPTQAGTLEATCGG